MIEVNHLSRRFGGFTAVDDLSFTVRPGEVLGFLGPNGAGKSTTMKMIAGFIAPSAGSVSIFGRDVQEQTLAARRLIGYLPEGAPSYEDMGVREFLLFIGKVRGFGGSELGSRVSSVVQRMECGDHWLLYAQVEHGGLLDASGIPAVHQRRIGSAY